MNKLVEDLFKFLRNIIEFIKIVDIFFVMMLIFYWIQDLTSSAWGWFKIFKPILDFVLHIASLISSGSVNIFGVIFEYKYPIAIIIFLIVYKIMDLIINLSFFSEDLYRDGCRKYNQFELERYNKSFQKQQTQEQSKIKNYMIYVEALPKSQKKMQELKIDLEAIRKELLKHLIDKIGTCPEKYCDGFLFKFLSINDIDTVIGILQKLPKVSSPVDYVMCVEIMDSDFQSSMKKLTQLISLKILNRVITMADTVYRYDFNSSKNYKDSSLGIYKKDDLTFEVYEFIENSAK